MSATSTPQKTTPTAPQNPPVTKKVTAEGGAILGSEAVTEAVPRACDVPPVAKDKKK